MTVFGWEEKAAVLRVMDSGVLSGYTAGCLTGGPEVEALEAEWAARFGFRHAVAMNSATSCLMAACGAVGVGESHEVIVPPLTMSATATACLPWGATPVFCDIEPDYFCLNPEGLTFTGPGRTGKGGWSAGTRAIITVDLFGQMSNPALRKIADDFGMALIQDASQRPLPGGFGDIVVYSLNYHKHIHCGEGGVACTNDDTLAHRLRLIRNHGENASGWDQLPSPQYGFNFRLTELQAAIARVQLTKLDAEIARRQKNAQAIPNLAPVRPGFEHAWYLYPQLYPNSGSPPENSVRYASPLYRLPLFSLGNPDFDFPVTELVWAILWVTKP